MKIFPTFMFDPFAAEPDLVLDRGVTLQVRSVSGVDYGDHGISLREDRRDARITLRARSVDGLSIPALWTARGGGPLPAAVRCRTAGGRPPAAKARPRGRPCGPGATRRVPGE